MSFFRPRNVSIPAAVSAPRSPVWYQPSGSIAAAVASGFRQ